MQVTRSQLSHQARKYLLPPHNASIRGGRTPPPGSQQRKWMTSSQMVQPLWKSVLSGSNEAIYKGGEEWVNNNNNNQ